MSRIKFSDTQLADMVMELIGEIEPVGESNTDDKRFDNLIRLQGIVDILLDEMYFVCAYTENHEYSMKRAGEQATKWMKEKREWLNGFLDEGSGEWMT